MRLSVLHVLPGLGFGGTEFVVARLARAERAVGVQNKVLYFKGGGPLVEELRKEGIPCQRLTYGAGLSALARWIFPLKKKGLSFDLVHGWLYSGNLMAGVLSRGIPGTKLVWNLMQANLTPEVNSPKTRFLMAIGAHLSTRWPDRIVYNSVAAQKAHEGTGFDSSKMTVIPNGVDTDRFSPNPVLCTQFKRENNLTSDTIILGHLARWDPQKDHRRLVEAFRLLVSQGVNAHLFMAGPGVTKENTLLMKWIQETGAPDRFHLLGPIEDAPRFLAGLDIFCLSSLGESSSYALMEAMACGVPAVVTDVGDARDVVGDTGVVVPPAQPQAFCDGLKRLTSLSSAARTQKGAQARDRIVRDYSFKKMVDAYQTLYQSILQRDPVA
ncbi:MAG: glycosyltransferase [Elusimicrobia bacterium]|nr:glycosyltransferase [Elusimicrobiota bacterium]